MQVKCLFLEVFVKDIEGKYLFHDVCDYVGIKQTSAVS